MFVISIDGACRRNGKPDCVAAGGVLIRDYDRRGCSVHTETRSACEFKSTNQRGELLALRIAMNHILAAGQPAQIITDSEYLFNTMAKEWFKSWQSAGWVTSTGTPVKNRDLWMDIVATYTKCLDADIDIVFYHIKGHCIPFGKVTADDSLTADPTGKDLWCRVFNKYEEVCDTSKRAQLDHANELSARNNGFKLDEATLQRFVVANVVADAVATKCVEEADLIMHRQ